MKQQQLREQELQQQEEEAQREAVKRRREEAMERERIALKQRLIDNKLKSKMMEKNQAITIIQEDNDLLKTKGDSRIERQSIRQLSRESKQVNQKIQTSPRQVCKEDNDQVLQQSISDSPDESFAIHIAHKENRTDVHRSKPHYNGKKLRKTKSSLFDEINHPYAQPLISKRSRPSRRGSLGSNIQVRLQPMEDNEISIRFI